MYLSYLIYSYANACNFARAWHKLEDHIFICVILIYFVYSHSWNVYTALGMYYFFGMLVFLLIFWRVIPKWYNVK